MSNLHPATTYVENNVLYVRESELAARRAAVARRLKASGLTKARSIVDRLPRPISMSIDPDLINSIASSDEKVVTLTASQVHDAWAIGKISFILLKQASYVIVTSRGENVAIYWRE